MIDLKIGEKVVFKKGFIVEVVRVSILILGIFVFEVIDGWLFVDGGVVDCIFVLVVKEMGFDIVIGVDVLKVKVNVEISFIFDVIM